MVFSAPCFSCKMLIYCLITVICYIDMMRCLLFSGKSTWMPQSVEDTSFLEACVVVDLPPRLSPQATYTPAPSFSIQAPIESKDNHHENAGHILLAMWHCHGFKRTHRLLNHSDTATARCLQWIFFLCCQLQTLNTIKYLDH